MVSACAEACSRVPIPSIDKAINRVKPNTPPLTVNRVLRWPYKAPWLSASRPLGPGVSDRPNTAVRKISQVCRAIRQVSRCARVQGLRGPASLCFFMLCPDSQAGLSRTVAFISLGGARGSAIGLLKVIVSGFLAVGALILNQFLAAIH